MSTYFVRPKEPTVLSHKEYYELTPTNLLLSSAVRPQLLTHISGDTLTPVLTQVPIAHVIPEILDIDRFSVAVSSALSSFPLLAGRLVRPNIPGNPWAVRPFDFLPHLDLTMK
jgi:hypothetical protein